MTGAEVITGADIVGALLLADVDVVAFARAQDIKTGRLPDGVKLPAFLIKVVSVIERQELKRGATTHTIERVSVAVRAANHRDRKLGMFLVTRCCAGRTGDIGGAQKVSILTAGRGPEVDGPANSFEQTQDFRVEYDA